jgi:gliding motility-associated-like protein
MKSYIDHNKTFILKARLLSVCAFAIYFSMQSAFAQPLNDLCASAIHIPNADSYCSDPGEYTNVNATGAGQFTTSCLIPLINEVWFTIVPQAPALIIQVSGNVNGLGTMLGPGIFLFEGTCGTLNNVGCNISASGTNVTELTVTDLVIGGVYYIAVIGATTGTFQICVDGFIPPPNPEGDCSKAVVLCDKSSFFIENVIGIGDPVINEVNGTCVPEETASVWYKWTCEQSGSLTFTLTPNNNVAGFESDDLDFVVYELPGGLNDCNNKMLLRCEAAGANTTGGVVDALPTWIQCNGPTGLRAGESDFVEVGGCMGANNNYVAPIDMVAGRSYALIVNNYSQSGQGFSIDFGGTGTFLGPEPDFEIEAVEAFECDKTIIFTNLSLSPTDSIVNWSWNFGAGASPIFVTGNGPHAVVYASFGAKRAALTVESERGCIVTKIIDLFVKPCCADTSTLDAGALAEDLICPGVPTGVITGIGDGGAVPYQFSLDGITYQPSTVFPGLGAGSYSVYIQDSKGCRDSTVIDILDAPPFTVDAGDTIFVDLGEPAQLNAIPFPPSFDSVFWSPPFGLQFTGDDLRPIALAPGTTVYTVTVTNDAGCLAIDSVVVFVNIVRPIYVPNVFSPNGDGVNDFFYFQGSPAAHGIEVIRIFDRWGALIFEDYGVDLNDPSRGWDGTFKDEYVNPGVFTYYANVLFLDNETLTYSGTITVLR